jgi:hypothetical protein
MDGTAASIREDAAFMKKVEVIARKRSSRRQTAAG